MRYDSSGMMHCRKLQIPSSASVIKGLMVFISSIMMFLSDLLMSESLKPGVSMSFIKLISATLTQWVTA